jgi:hypothetical protein
MSVQCRFSKVRADSHVVRKLLCGDDDLLSGSGSEASELIVNEGDYITLQGWKLYVVTSLLPDGTVRCESPSFPINDPIVITMKEATKALMRAIG